MVVQRSNANIFEGLTLAYWPLILKMSDWEKQQLVALGLSALLPSVELRQSLTRFPVKMLVTSVAHRYWSLLVEWMTMTANVLEPIETKR